MSNLTSIYGGNQTLINDPNLCTLQTCDLTLASLTYVPNLAGNALYLAFFALFLIAQTFLGIRYKTWGFCFAIFLGLVGLLSRCTCRLADLISKRHSKSWATLAES